MKYAWIDGQRRAYPLPAMCGTLSVSVSGYRAWRRGGSPNRKRLTNAQLLAVIKAICVWCVTSAVIVTLIFAASLADSRRHRASYPIDLT